MTLEKLISLVKEEKPNTFSEAKLTEYVNDIEAEVAEQFLTDAPTYEWDKDKETLLLAKRPYDKLYVSFVKAKIDYANEEYESYTNNATQHAQDFKELVDWIVRDGIAPGITRFKHIF